MPYDKLPHASSVTEGRNPPSSIWWWGSVTWCTSNAMVQGTCACGDQVFPGARSDDASLWGAGRSWGSQWRRGVATTGQLFGALKADLWGPVEPQQLGLWHFFIICRSDVTHICGDQVAPARRWRRSQSEVAKWVFVLRPTLARSKLQPLRPTDFSLQITRCVSHGTALCE